MKHLIGFAFLLTATGAPQDARDRKAELERKIVETRSRLESDQEGLQQLEKLLQDTAREVVLETVRRGQAGDAAALQEALAQFDTSGSFVEYAWAEAFKGRGADLVKLVRDRWPAASDVFKSKMCWLLGLSGGAEAGAYLRSILEQGDRSGDVVGNAVHALRGFPRGEHDEELVGRYAKDAREIKRPIGYYQAGFKPAPTLGGVASDFIAEVRPGERATVPGKIVVEAPTLVSLGFEWHIEGDHDLDCSVSVAYRKKGEEAWKQGFPFLRCDPRPNPTHGGAPGNLLAGSVFDLEPDTEYEVKLTLLDPDGGKDERVVPARTRAEPRAFEGGRTLYVVPGDGGGTGAKENPFRGLEEADKAARPGDLFLLQEGVYRGGRLNKSGEPGKPIVYRGVDAEKVTIDKQLEKVKSDEALNISKLKHLHFERIGITGGTVAVTASATEDIVFRRCKIFGYRTVGIRALATSLVKGGPPVNCRNWYVADNVILGPATWEKGRRSDSFGVCLSGEGHVVCYNRIENCWDCVGISGGAKPDTGVQPRTVSCDVYGNDLRQATDDGVECDYTWHNIRVFRNRLNNTFSGLSFQPIFGGPGYFLHNALYNTTNKPFKLHVDPSGVVVAHNTCAASVEPFYGGGFNNALFRNNLLLGVNGERGGYWLSTNATRMDMDFTGYNRPGPGRFIKYNNVLYDHMAAFTAGTGQGRNNVLLDWDVFANLAPLPGPQKRLDDPSRVDLRIRPGSKAVDAGVVLPGINDGFSGKAPDLGCYEVGQPIPHYGPRPEGRER